MSGSTSRTLPVGKQEDVPGFSVRKFFTVVVVMFSLIPLGLFVFSLLGRYFFLAELIGSFRAQILVMLLPCPFLLWILKQPKWGAVMALATAWCATSVMLIYLPGGQPPAGPRQIKLMSFNVWGNNPSRKKAIQLIEDEDPDILTVLEYCERWTGILKQLDERYPFQVLEPRWHGFGIAVFSKYPIKSSEVHQLASKLTDNPAIFVDIEIGDQSLRIAGIHALSPTDHIRLDIRNKQLAEMSMMLSRSEDPTIVMGDFNCTPWSPYLSDLIKTTGYRDSRQGFGFQPSFPAGLWPLRIPIDQAFVSKQIHVHERRMGKSAGSDHLPLILEVSISSSGQP